jgi:ATP-binding cassette, subfamily G (WHITE), member 2, SNQ2
VCTLLVLASQTILIFHFSPTRGLDASTALKFGQTLRIITDLSKTTTIVSLYQASETLYSLFDKVCVIYDGRMAYFGPGKDVVKTYLEKMGYVPANRQTTADFIVAATDPNARIQKKGWNGPPPPKTAEEFAAYFLQSEFGRRNKDDINSYRALIGVGTKEGAEMRSLYEQSVKEDHAKGTRRAS